MSFKFTPWEFSRVASCPVSHIEEHFIFSYTRKYSWYETQSHYLSNEGFGVMIFNTTFSNISIISWREVLLVEETGEPKENHRPVASHWQTLSPYIVSSKPRLRGVRLKNIFLEMYTDFKSVILSPCCISKIKTLIMQHQHMCLHVTEIVFVIFTSILPSGNKASLCRSRNNCLFIVPKRSCNFSKIVSGQLFWNVFDPFMKFSFHWCFVKWLGRRVKVGWH